MPGGGRDHRLYAVCAFIGGWVLVLAPVAGVPPGWALVLSAATTGGLRALALVTGYTLPRWSADRPLRR